MAMEAEAITDGEIHMLPCPPSGEFSSMLLGDEAGAMSLSGGGGGGGEALAVEELAPPDEDMILDDIDVTAARGPAVLQQAVPPELTADGFGSFFPHTALVAAAAAAGLNDEDWLLDGGLNGEATSDDDVAAAAAAASTAAAATAVGKYSKQSLPQLDPGSFLRDCVRVQCARRTRGCRRSRSRSAHRNPRAAHRRSARSSALPHPHLLPYAQHTHTHTIP